MTTQVGPGATVRFVWPVSQIGARLMMYPSCAAKASSATATPTRVRPVR